MMLKLYALIKSWWYRDLFVGTGWRFWVCLSFGRLTFRFKFRLLSFMALAAVNADNQQRQAAGNGNVGHIENGGSQIIANADVEKIHHRAFPENAVVEISQAATQNHRKTVKLAAAQIVVLIR